MSLSNVARIAACCFVVAAVALAACAAAADETLRPPAVPLVTANPNLSIWSEATKLTDDVTRHWTHRPHALVGLIRIDGKAYRLMGNDPKDVEPLQQTGLVVLPTRSVYDFEGAGVHVALTFMTPALNDDLEVLARPVTYLTWTVRSTDGKAHAVSVYDGTSSALAVNEVRNKVTWARETMGELTALRVGAEPQTLLAPAGDDTRINWGYAYAVAGTAHAKAAVGGNDALMKSFVESGKLPERDDERMPRAVSDDQPVLAFVLDLGSVAAEPVARHVMVGYDEVYAIKYFTKRLRPYWRHAGATPAELFQAAERDYVKLVERCEAFDKELMADLTKAGGERYAQIAALAYRQGLAGCGLAVDEAGTPLLFTKENTSNGCIATVDVIYPAAPQFLLMGPTYAKALVAPAMAYGASKRWRFPFAPHDLGVYPQATGQVYGGGETSTNEGEMMPVEESANLIILCDAIARMDGNADFASQWWPQLTAWEAYLEKYGKDPENQLCTDDFMGHLAHNANLSVKAILAIAAYGDLSKMRGDAAAGDKYLGLAREYARNWMRVAADGGDHYRIAFDKPNTWSQKYNLVWDKLLDYRVFPYDVAKSEVAYYKKVMQRYGVPLDSRTHLTKTDWSVWSATMAEDDADFRAIVSPIWDYLNQTTARSPLVDSYVTDNVKSDGMHARPVIGGVFVKMLADQGSWRKWGGRDKAKVGTWAATVPPPPVVTIVVPTAEQKPAPTWRYTTTKPADDWAKADFDDAQWNQGPGGFGTRGTPGAIVGTRWNSPDIWIRRTVTLPAGEHPNLQMLVYHDEDVEVYVNGVLAAIEAGYVNKYQPLEIGEAARAVLKPGATVTIAAHCHQTTGGQGVDVGLADVKNP